MSLAQQVWYLERALFEMFPEKAKESWDNCGVIVGDKEAVVEGIAVALDPTVDAIHFAADNGCNVLLTHHPVFLKPPYLILSNGPGTWSTQGSERDSVEQAMAGEAVYAAIRRNVSLIAMHTNFDSSARSQHVLPDALDLTYLNPLEQTIHKDGIGAGEVQGGLGQLSSVPAMTLRELSLRCKQVFGITPRVWGDPDHSIKFVATCPGSAWPLINDVTRCEFDCFICGEVRYHTALAAKAAGISIIELGHDVSERLFVNALYEAVIDIGYAKDKVMTVPPQINWWTV